MILTALYFIHFLKTQHTASPLRAPERMMFLHVENSPKALLLNCQSYKLNVSDLELLYQYRGYISKGRKLQFLTASLSITCTGFNLHIGRSSVVEVGKSKLF